MQSKFLNGRSDLPVTATLIFHSGVMAVSCWTRTRYLFSINILLSLKIIKTHGEV